MHELGIVFYIVRDVKQIAEENTVARVAKVRLEIGEVSGVISSYLTDCWSWAAAKEPLLTDCELVVDSVPAVTFCEDCKQEYPTVKYGKTCPNCQSGNTYLLRGNEINIKEIEVVDASEGATDREVMWTGSAEAAIESGLKMQELPTDFETGRAFSPEDAETTGRDDKPDAAAAGTKQDAGK